MPKSRVLAVLTVLACVGALASPVRAQDAPQAYERTPGMLETTTGPDETYPVTLDHDIWVPEGASAADPRPAMVIAHGFGNSKDVGEVTTLAAFFAGKGYVVIASTHQGFGQSSGCVALDSVDYDARNVSRLIDLLAARDDVLMDAPGDPRVGMAGGSYGGGHQGLVAATDPRLDAIAPARTWNSLQFSLVPNNLIGDGGTFDLEHYEQGVFKSTWSSLFTTVAATQPAMGNGGCDPVTQQTLYPGQPPCPGFDPMVCPIFASLSTTGDVTAEQRAFVARSSVANVIDDVTVPVLLTQGQSDTLFTPVEATATFEALRAAGNDDVFMLWNWGGHGYAPRPGEGEPYNSAYDDSPEAQEAFRATTYADRIGRFFDHYLRGIGHPGPRFSVFRDWVEYSVPTVGDRPVGNADAAYAMVGRGPAEPGFAGGAGTSYRLTDEGLEPIGAGPHTDDAPILSATLLNPPNGLPAAHSETPNFTDEGQPGAGIPPSEVPGQHVALDTPPFTAPAEVVGIPTLRLHVANSNGRDAVLFTKLYDVAPDGTATLIKRMVAASRIPADLLPGMVELRLPAVVHRFETGHAARLVVATTDDSYRTAPVADRITLSTDGAVPSILRLPLVGGDTVGRIAGDDRIATAVALSEEAFGEARDAVLVNADAFPDALTAGPLAAAVEGPTLLTSGAALDPRVADDLYRLGVDRVHLVGGTGVLGDAVRTSLEGMGIEVVRLAGSNRITTAGIVADRIAALTGGPAHTAIVARADDFADALAAGGLAVVGGGVGGTAQRTPVPILLIDDASVAEVARIVQRVTFADAPLVVAGGDRAVSTAAADGLGRAVRRLAGADRYQTAVALASAATDAGAGLDMLLIASGVRFPDALAGVPAAAAMGGIVLIVPPDGLEEASSGAGFLRASATVADRAALIGGTAVLPDELRSGIGPLLVAEE